MEQLSFIDKIRNLIYVLGVKLKIRGDKIIGISKFNKFDEIACIKIIRFCKRMHKKYGVTYKVYSVKYCNSPNIYIEVSDGCVSPMIRDYKYLKEEMDFQWILERYYGAYLWDFIDEGWPIYSEDKLKDKKLIFEI